MNVMTDQQRQSVTDTALIEVLAETDHWDHDIDADGITVEEFLCNCFADENFSATGTIRECCTEYTKNGKNEKLQVLCSAYLENENFRNTVIVDIDKSNGAMVTKTFGKEPKDTMYTVAFCGTRGAHLEWPDNAEGLIHESSAAQRSAADYFDMMSSRFDEDAKIVVTGHSKGGNKAQYVTMFANNRGLIDDCVALDGQGFSKRAMEAMQNHTDYEAQRDKITLVCGSDDYVHVLGERLAKANKTFYVEGGYYQEGLEHIEKDHLVQYMFQNENGVFSAKLKADAEQGVLGAFAEKLYDRLAETYSPEEFATLAHTAMDLISNGLDVNKLLVPLEPLIPTIKEVLTNTPEGKQFVIQLNDLKLSVSLDLDLATLAKLGLGIVYYGLFEGQVLSFLDDVKFDLWLRYGIGPSPYTTTGNEIASRNEQLVVDTDVLSACASQLRQLQGKANEISKDLKLAFGAKRGYQSDSDIVIGGIVDTFHRDWSDLEAAQSSLSEAAKGMKHIAKALDSMRGFMEDAETTATKYGRSGG